MAEMIANSRTELHHYSSPTCARQLLQQLVCCCLNREVEARLSHILTSYQTVRNLKLAPC